MFFTLTGVAGGGEPELELGRTGPALTVLAVLVLSARGEEEEALRLCDHALTEYPDNLVLMNVKARLEEKVQGGEKALETARAMLHHLRDLGEAGGGGGGGGRA